MSGRRLEARVILIGLAGIQLVNGIWATVAPASFYEDFPPGIGGWVSALPAYNEHLMRDVGALFLATGFVLLAAAVWLERRLVAIALVSYLLFSVPHAIFHLFNLEPYGTGDGIGNVLALAATVLLPIWLLSVLWRQGATPPQASAGASDGGEARVGAAREGVSRPSPPAA